MNMNGRDWALVAGGAAVASLAAIGIHMIEAPPAGATLGREQEVAALRAHAGLGEPSAARKGGHSAKAAVGAVPPVPRVDELKGKLAEVQRQKRDLEAQLRIVEEELARRPEKSPAPERDEFDLKPEDWKELSATGHIKYRVPCILPSNTPYKIPQEELDQLGLSPEDGEVLTDSLRRSNARIWAALRPLCAQIVHDEDAVELLGAQSCMSLIERAATKSDPMGSFEARRAVGEVHAGLRAPPPAAEQSPVYQAYMAFTSEGSQFESDLSESFGPEEARRIAQNQHCTSTRK